MSKFDLVLDMVKNHIGEGYDVTVGDFLKNNDTHKTGVVIRKNDSNVSSVIYVTEEQLDQMDENDIALSVYKTFKKGEQNIPLIEVDEYDKRDFILANVEYRLIGTEKNKKKLANSPHKDFEDMAAVYVVIINRGEESMTSFTLSNTHMEIAGITIQEIDAAAQKNTFKKEDMVFMDLNELVFSMICPGKINTINIDDIDFLEFGAYVLTNRTKSYGAVFMMCSEVLASIAEKAGKDLLVLPSSIHEVIILPCDEDLDVEHLKNIVNDANVMHVEPEDVLTSSVYRFEREAGKLKVC